MLPLFRMLLLISLSLRAAVGFAQEDPPRNAQQQRSNLENARYTFEHDKRGTVAFLGGSITEMNGYRPMVCQYLQQRFPDTQFTFINAGISSTCSATGAFRLQRDVLSKEPDLLFVEFAVNDDQDAGHPPRECVRGMEGILRQALLQLPTLDIVMTHFVNPSMLETLQQGGSPISSAQHERVAAHYGISTNDVGRELASRIAAGKFSWQSYGGTHPKEPGNRLAADGVIELLEAAWAKPRKANASLQQHALPQPLDGNSYFRGRFLAVDSATLEADWVIERPDWKKLPGQSRATFDKLPLLCSTTPGAELSLRFSGTAVGAFVLAGPDAGMVEVTIDDLPPREVNLFHHYSKGLHYPRTVMFATDLPPGEHQLRLKIANRHHEASLGHAVRIMEFVAN